MIELGYNQIKPLLSSMKDKLKDNKSAFKSIRREYEDKKEFLIDLIPFYPIYKAVRNQWRWMN